MASSSTARSLSSANEAPPVVEIPRVQSTTAALETNSDQTAMNGFGSNNDTNREQPFLQPQQCKKKRPFEDTLTGTPKPPTSHLMDNASTAPASLSEPDDIVKSERHQDPNHHSSNKKRPYIRTKRPKDYNDRSTLTRMNTAAVQASNVYNGFLAEAADLAQAAAEAQQLGRIKMASAYLLLLHARLVGLGKRFDRTSHASSNSNFSNDNNSSPAASGNSNATVNVRKHSLDASKGPQFETSAMESLLVAATTPGQDDNDQQEQAPTNATSSSRVSAATTGALSLSSPMASSATLSPASTTTTRSTAWTTPTPLATGATTATESVVPQTVSNSRSVVENAVLLADQQSQQRVRVSLDDDDNKNYDSDKPRVPSLGTMLKINGSNSNFIGARTSNPKATTLVRATPNESASNSTAATTTTTVEHDPLKNTSLSRPAIVQNMETAPNEAHHRGLIPDVNEREDHKQQKEGDGEETSSMAATTSAARQLARRFLSSHIELDEAMMEHLAKAAAELHRARLEKGGNNTTHLTDQENKAAPDGKQMSHQHATTKASSAGSGDKHVNNNKAPSSLKPPAWSVSQMQTLHQVMQDAHSSKGPTGTSSLMNASINAAGKDTAEMSSEPSSLATSSSASSSLQPKELAAKTGRTEHQVRLFLRNRQERARVVQAAHASMLDDTSAAAAVAADSPTSSLTLASGSIDSMHRLNNGTHPVGGTGKYSFHLTAKTSDPSDASQDAASAHDRSYSATTSTGHAPSTTTTATAGSHDAVPSTTAAATALTKQGVSNVGGRVRRPPTAAVSTMPNASCDVRTLLHGSLLPALENKDSNSNDPIQQTALSPSTSVKFSQVRLR